MCWVGDGTPKLVRWLTSTLSFISDATAIFAKRYGYELHLHTNPTLKSSRTWASLGAPRSVMTRFGCSFGIARS
jgi:hypothetical protein